MSRGSRSFNRPKPKYKPQPRLLVICEDKKSSNYYLQEASDHFRANVEVAHCGKTDPLGIVEEALKRQSDFESIYCAIDRDDHKNFDEAMTVAKTSNKLEVIVSYPCFEYWLFLHFSYSRKPYMPAGSSSAADQLLKDLCAIPEMQNYTKGGKELLFNRLLGRLDTAKQNAGRSLKDAISCGSPNPSTRIHDLLAVFEAMEFPQEA